MRTIKFRAWDTSKGKMYPNPDIGTRGAFVELNTIFTHPDNKDWILMQFTGLKDKNGKEIYEGDIMEGRYSKGVFVRRGPVYFSDGRWMVKIQGVPRHIKTISKKFSVVGNLYETPNLLK